LITFNLLDFVKHGHYPQLYIIFYIVYIQLYIILMTLTATGQWILSSQNALH